MRELAWKRFRWGTLLLEFKVHDLWIGAYWSRGIGHTDIWICLVPCLPVHIVIGGMRLSKKRKRGE